MTPQVFFLAQYHAFEQHYTNMSYQDAPRHVAPRPAAPALPRPCPAEAIPCIQDGEPAWVVCTGGRGRAVDVHPPLIGPLWL